MQQAALGSIGETVDTKEVEDPAGRRYQRRPGVPQPPRGRQDGTPVPAPFAPAERLREHMTELATISTHVEAMRRAYGEIESARTIDEVKDIRDRAEAARQYAKAAGYSRDITNMCAEIKLRAERQAGLILAQLRDQGLRAEPGRPGKTRHDDGIPKPTLVDLGVADDPVKADNRARRWQKLADIPDGLIDDYVKDVNCKRCARQHRNRAATR
jgi:hypothetical protein